MQVGQRHNRLIAVREAGRSKWGSRLGVFLCDCGNECTKVISEVKRGRILSCGCVHTEIVQRIGHANTTHGMSNSPEYISWRGMLSRCGNPKDRFYHRYGGRGIQVCEEWKDSFQAFFAHVGRKPSPAHSIDRRKNDGHYEPGNVRWATAQEQAENRSVRTC